jgi:hypothetical protein
LKLHAARAVDQSQSDKPADGASGGADKKNVSLSEPAFRTKILQGILDLSKRISETTIDSSKTPTAYCDSAIDLQDRNVEIYA